MHTLYGMTLKKEKGLLSLPIMLLSL